MFRRWLSNFYRNNKEKISKFIKVFGVLILVGIALANSIGNNSNNGENNNEPTIYNPTETIISGSNVDKEIYKEEENQVKTFVDYCNKQQIEEAYNILTEKCKEKMYPTLESFKKNYYDVIFSQTRECSLQSWITSGDYNTYKVTFMEDIMYTGNYDNVEKIIDYITIETKNGEKKLNLNSYIKTEEINKATKTEELEIVVESADIYINNVKYNLSISNISNKDILLDNLENDSNVKFVGSNGAEYALNRNNLFSSDLLIYENSKNKKIELKFDKQYGSEVTGESIELKNVIINYEEYLKDKSSYSEYKKISIKL